MLNRRIVNSAGPLLKAAGTLLTFLLVARLFHAAWVDSMDFGVYWKAAQLWIQEGRSPYDPVYLKEVAQQGFVFKYPPWILALFFPLGWFDPGISKLLWATLELFCLGFSIYRLRKLGVRAAPLAIITLMFWWIWLGHFFAGQFTILLLAAALWAYPPGIVLEPSAPARAPGPFRLAFASVLFSAKVFTGVSLLGIWRELLKPRVIAWALGMVLGGWLLVVGWLRWQGSRLSGLELLSQWIHAAASGGTELPEYVIRGQMNHSFTAGVLRWLRVPASNTRADILVFVLLTAILAPLWTRLSRPLPPLERWAGWLALGLLVHPLAWHHSFVLAFPLCVLALDRAKNRLQKALALAGTACIGLVIPNIWGLALVTPLENLSIKSWGICFAAYALVMSTQKRPQ